MAEYDVFISHANDDKESFVNELKSQFALLGIKIFYDVESIGWGDDWEQKINEGLDKCRFGVVIISKNFYDRKWTEKELKTLFNRQYQNGENVILPILYNTTFVEMKQHYKKLSKIQFVDASKKDCKDITILLARKLLHDKNDIGVLSNTISNNVIFDNFFEDADFSFYEWADQLTHNKGEWIEGYDTDVIGWHLLSIDGKYIELIQQKKVENNSNSVLRYDSRAKIEYVYRVNPIYYDDFCKYFEEYIRPQM